MKRCLAAMLASFFLYPQTVLGQTPAAVPAPEATPAGPSSGVVRTTLANGMRVILLPNNLAPVATTLMTYGVGSDDDPTPGIAHATEHMLFRGTTDLSSGQLADISARMGAEYNAFTTNESTAYYFKLPSAYVDLALHIEADRMTKAAIRASDWATERGAIQGEVRGRESQPGYAIAVKLQQTFFAGTPFAVSALGTVDGFAKMTAADIARFYHTWYHPGDATLIVAGDIDPAHTLAQIHAIFDDIPAGTIPARKPIEIPALGSSTMEESMDFPVGFGALMYRMPSSRSNDFAASLVLGQVFNSGRGALADLSAQGKILGAAAISSANSDVGAAFLVAIPGVGGTPASALALVNGVLDRYRKDGVPQELIDAAKTRVLSERAYRQASISGLGVAWAQSVELGLDNPDSLYAAVENVSADDVNRVVHTYLDPAHQVAVTIRSKPSTSVPKVNPGAGEDDVTFTPSAHEALPAWALAGFDAPLRPPTEDTDTIAHTAPNGLTLAVRRETTAPAIIVRGVVRSAPDLYEPAGKDGVNLVLASMFPFGTVAYDRTAYQTELDRIAASVSLGTSFSLKVQSKDLERGIELLADGMLHPALSLDAFKVAKAAVLQSVGVANALPATKADLASRLALYAPGDPRRRDVTVKTVGAVTLADVKRYYKFAFRPDLTTIVIVGDVTPERARDVVGRYFGAWKATGARPNFQYPPESMRVGRGRGRAPTITVKSETADQSAVTLRQRMRISRGEPDYVTLVLANTILSGEGTGSLLYQDLRSRHGYVYTVTSDFDAGSIEGEFSVSYASAPKDVARAGAAAISVIRRLQTVPLPAVDLQRAKALLVAQRVLPLDSYDGVASDIISGAQQGYPILGTEKWFWNQLLATTPAQLQRAMRRIQPELFLRIVVEPGS